MQNCNYQQSSSPPTMPVYYPLPPRPNPRQQQKRTLRKTSNGLGFFVLAYFLLMQQVAVLISGILRGTGVVTKESENIYLFFLQIIAGVASSLVAVLFYRLFSHRRLSDNFTNSRLSPDLLIPMIAVGMGAAMLANQLAALFDQNISLFELKNTVSMSTETQSVPEILLYIVSTAVAPAFAEELAFRGVFMNIMRRYGDAFAIITSAVVFGAMHGNTTQIIFAFVLGLIFAFVDCKANSIVPSVIIHFVNNFYAVTSDIISNNTDLNSGTLDVIRITIIAVFCLLGILSYIYLAKRDANFFAVTDRDQNGIAETNYLTLKEKFMVCFTSPGIIVSLSVFTLEMILNLLPKDTLENAVRNVTGG